MPKLFEQPGGSSEKQYDKKEWEKLKKKNAPAFVVRRGRELGVPREELNQFAEKIIEEAIKNQEYGFVFRFMMSMGIGTQEGARSVGEQAYRFFIKNGDHGSAMSIAEDVYGKNSEEWRRASKAVETAYEDLEKRKKSKEQKIESGKWSPFATLAKDSTFADLFRAIESHKEWEDLDHLFVQELWDNFDSETAEEILSFRDAQPNKAVDIKILTFFKERGYSQDDITALLPVKFVKGKNK